MFFPTYDSFWLVLLSSSYYYNFHSIITLRGRIPYLYSGMENEIKRQVIGFRWYSLISDKVTPRTTILDIHNGRQVFLATRNATVAKALQKSRSANIWINSGPTYAMWVFPGRNKVNLNRDTSIFSNTKICAFLSTIVGVPVKKLSFLAKKGPKIQKVPKCEKK